MRGEVLVTRKPVCNSYSCYSSRQYSIVLYLAHGINSKVGTTRRNTSALGIW